MPLCAAAVHYLTIGGDRSMSTQQYCTPRGTLQCAISQSRTPPRLQVYFLLSEQNLNKVLRVTFFFYYYSY